MIGRRTALFLTFVGLAACAGGGGGGSSVAPPAAATAAPSPVPSGAPSNLNSSPLTLAQPVDPRATPMAMAGDLHATAILANAKLGAVHMMGVLSGQTTTFSAQRAPRAVAYPEDMFYSGGSVISSAQIHPVYIQTIFDSCSTACWGNPGQTITDLAASTFLHIVDPFVGYTQANRYTLGSGVLWGLAPLPSHAGNPVIGQSDILLLLHYTSQSYGAGYNHLYEVFLPPNVDTCFDLTGICYSPDNPPTFAFCGYHSAVNYGNGPIIYSVIGYSDVPGCSVGSGPHASGGHNITDSMMRVMSHEVFEQITDPEPFSGWYNPFVGMEVGDACTQYVTTIPMNGPLYKTQPEYSNAYHACTNAP